MQIMDSPVRYGAVTRFFHWSVAALILWQFLGMGLKNALGRDNAIAGFMTGTHGSVGFVIFALVWLRVVWAVLNRRHRPAQEGAVPGWAVKFGHLALYVLLLFVPTVAVMRAFGGERPFAVFGVQLSAGHPAGQGIEALTAPASLHGEMAWLLGVLILGHILMVVFHSAVLKDRTVATMTRA